MCIRDRVYKTMNLQVLYEKKCNIVTTDFVTYMSQIYGYSFKICLKILTANKIYESMYETIRGSNIRNNC